MQASVSVVVSLVPPSEMPASELVPVPLPLPEPTPEPEPSPLPEPAPVSGRTAPSGTSTSAAPGRP